MIDSLGGCHAAHLVSSERHNNNDTTSVVMATPPGKDKTAMLVVDGNNRLFSVRWLTNAKYYM